MQYSTRVSRVQNAGRFLMLRIIAILISLILDLIGITHFIWACVDLEPISPSQLSVLDSDQGGSLFLTPRVQTASISSLAEMVFSFRNQKPNPIFTLNRHHHYRLDRARHVHLLRRVCHPSRARQVRAGYRRLRARPQKSTRILHERWRVRA
jgi:hypothetical protein